MKVQVQILKRNRLITENQAAQLLGVTRLTMMNRRDRGELSFYRMGRNIRYSLEDHILPYLAGCEQRIRNRRPKGERLQRSDVKRSKQKRREMKHRGNGAARRLAGRSVA